MKITNLKIRGPPSIHELLTLTLIELKEWLYLLCSPKHQ